MSATAIYRVEHAGHAVYALRQDNAWHRLEGDPFGGYRSGGVLGVESPPILPPVVPSKIVAVGLNYKDHAAEMNKPLPDEPLLFLKPSTAVIGPGSSIVLPVDAGRVDYEAEVGIVIGRMARDIPAEQAHEYVLGLTCVNDVTDRDLQRRDVQYTRAKGFDTFAPLGPCIAPAWLDRPITVESRVNGEVRQHSSTSELIFSMRRLVEFVSAVMTLLPGDIISTGTPPGVGPVVPGDTVVIAVEGVGELSNDVVSAGCRRD
ncbi:MAG: fumarylacetoacetate hydrolase family protein [Acidobacteriota bacterium]|nr:fumarylacetoacetate hydrolase family protein [Acidobacteriota bacterium]